MNRNPKDTVLKSISREICEMQREYTLIGNILTSVSLSLEPTFGPVTTIYICKACKKYLDLDRLPTEIGFYNYMKTLKASELI